MARKDKLTKSAERVRKYGEVFTPDHIVKKMCDELPAEAWEIGKTILEPSCGNGNFLVEIYRRKLEHCKSASQAVQALASIYGVDILPDNVQESRNRLLMMFRERYPSKDGFTATVIEILNRNIVCADFLLLAPHLKQAETWESAVEIISTNSREASEDEGASGNIKEV